MFRSERAKIGNGINVQIWKGKNWKSNRLSFMLNSEKANFDFRMKTNLRLKYEKHQMTTAHIMVKSMNCVSIFDEKTCHAKIYKNKDMIFHFLWNAKHLRVDDDICFILEVFVHVRKPVGEPFDMCDMFWLNAATFKHGEVIQVMTMTFFSLFDNFMKHWCLWDHFLKQLLIFFR